MSGRFKKGDRVILVNPHFEGKPHPQDQIVGIEGVIAEDSMGTHHGNHWPELEDHWAVQTTGSPKQVGVWWIQDDEGIQLGEPSQEEVDNAVASILKARP